MGRFPSSHLVTRMSVTNDGLKLVGGAKALEISKGCFQTQARKVKRGDTGARGGGGGVGGGGVTYCAMRSLDVSMRRDPKCVARGGHRLANIELSQTTPCMRHTSLAP